MTGRQNEEEFCSFLTKFDLDNHMFALPVGSLLIFDEVWGRSFHLWALEQGHESVAFVGKKFFCVPYSKWKEENFIPSIRKSHSRVFKREYLYTSNFFQQSLCNYLVSTYSMNLRSFGLLSIRFCLLVSDPFPPRTYSTCQTKPSSKSTLSPWFEA